MPLTDIIFAVEELNSARDSQQSETQGFPQRVLASTGPADTQTQGGITLAAGQPMLVEAYTPVATTIDFTTEPTDTNVNTTFTVAVSVYDQGGNPYLGSGTVTIALGSNPSRATLSGTLTAALASGVATFTGLSLDQGGLDYTLTASLAALSDTSAAFDITALPPLNEHWQRWDGLVAGGAPSLGADDGTLAACMAAYAPIQWSPSIRLCVANQGGKYWIHGPNGTNPDSSALDTIDTITAQETVISFGSY